jgi:hypothetical protein
MLIGFGGLSIFAGNSVTANAINPACRSNAMVRDATEKGRVIVNRMAGYPPYKA